MDQHYVPANLPPLVTQLVVRKFTIVSCDHWWPEFAQFLKELQLMYCTMTVDVLYGMLRRAPNLRRLVLYGAKLSGTAEPDFQLDRLTLLVVCCVGYEDNSRNILDGFERVFPRLEDLRLENNSMPTNILQSIRTLQNSLQYLTLQSYPNVLDELSELQQLRLKMLGLDVDVLRDDLATWTKLCRNQPLLENLKMSSNCIHVRSYYIPTPNSYPHYVTIFKLAGSPRNGSIAAQVEDLCVDRPHPDGGVISGNHADVGVPRNLRMLRPD